MSEHKLNICLVDDDEDDRVLIAALLNDVSAGVFELSWISSFDAGLEAMASQDYDIYLVDYRLGGRDGLELLKVATERGCKKPVILLTGQGDYEIDVEAMKAGAADYLEKEWIDGHILERSIRYAIGGKRAEAQLLKAHGELETRVRERTEELNRAYGELEQFSYMASHDLQEPLRAIEGVLKFLNDNYAGKLDSHADRLLARAADGVEIIRRANNRLLAYAGATKGEEALQQTDCSELIKEVLHSLEKSISESGGVVTHAELPFVMADARQLSNVFRHLIANAILHSGDQRPEIHISAEIAESLCTFSIQDNGVGVSPSQIEQIFYLFSPYHSRKADGGTGTSLAVCKKIVERHGGKIWVHSELGQGTTFRFSLPHKSGPHEGGNA